MRIEKPDIYYDVSANDYFDDPCPEPSFSQSIGKVLIDHSAMHARTEHPRLTTPLDDEDEEPEKYVVAQAIGNAAHKLIIGRGKEIAVGDFTSWRSGDSKDFKTAALEAGHVPILTKHMARAYAMEQAFRRQLEAHAEGDVFSAGRGEVVLAWQEDGFWFRCMVDWLHDDLSGADDLKTTGLSAAPHTLGTLAANGGWDIQAAMIERGLRALRPSTVRRKYRFVPLENYAPYGLSVMPMNEAWMTMGRKRLEYAITRWKIAMARGQWRGYPAVGVTPDYPGFKESQWLDREVSEAERPELSTENILNAG